MQKTIKKAIAMLIAIAVLLPIVTILATANEGSGIERTSIDTDDNEEGVIGFEPISIDLNENSGFTGLDRTTIDTSGNNGMPPSTRMPPSMFNDSDSSFEERMMAMMTPPSGFIEDSMLRQQFVLGTSGFDAQSQELTARAANWSTDFRVVSALGEMSFGMPEFRGDLGFMPDNFGRMNRLPDISGVFEGIQISMATDYAQLSGSVNFSDIMARNQAQGRSMMVAAGMGNFHGRLANIQSLSAHRVYEIDPEVVARREELQAEHLERSVMMSPLANMDVYLRYANHTAAAHASVGTGLFGGAFDGITPLGIATMSSDSIASVTASMAGYMLDSPEIGGALSGGHPLRQSLQWYSGRETRPQIDLLASVRDENNPWWEVAEYLDRHLPLIRTGIYGVPQFEVPEGITFWTSFRFWDREASMNSHGYHFNYAPTGNLRQVTTYDYYTIHLPMEWYFGDIMALRVTRPLGVGNTMTGDEAIGWMVDRGYMDPPPGWSR